MAKIMDTVLLGKDNYEVGIPHRNIHGTLYIENGGLAFWSGNKQVLFVPLDNINNYGADWSYKKGLDNLVGFASTLMTMALIDTSKVYYVWLIYWDGSYGKYLKVWFEVGRTFSNDRRANKLIDNIADAIKQERETIRQATRPQLRR